MPDGGAIVTVFGKSATPDMSVVVSKFVAALSITSTIAVERIVLKIVVVKGPSRPKEKSVVVAAGYLYSTVPSVAPGVARVTTVAGPAPSTVVVTAGYITWTKPLLAAMSIDETVVAGLFPE